VVLSKDSAEPLRSQTIQTIMKLRARTPIYALIHLSIFVGFKPTTAAEHLGSLQRYLACRLGHGASVSQRA
jgi:hypothetical protein